MCLMCHIFSPLVLYTVGRQFLCLESSAWLHWRFIEKRRPVDLFKGCDLRANSIRALHYYSHLLQTFRPQFTGKWECAAANGQFYQHILRFFFYHLFSAVLFNAVWEKLFSNLLKKVKHLKVTLIYFPFFWEQSLPLLTSVMWIKI